MVDSSIRTPEVHGPTNDNIPVKRQRLMRTKRASKACVTCRKRKVRCDVAMNGSPCVNCRLDQTSCVVLVKKKNYRSTSPPLEEETSTSALAEASCCQNDKAFDKDIPVSLTNQATTLTACTEDDICIAPSVHRKDHTPHAIYQNMAVETPQESLVGNFSSMLNEHILTCKLNAALLCGDFRSYMRPARLQKLALIMDVCCQQIRYMDVSSPAMASRYQAMQDAREALDSANAALSILESNISQCLRENRHTELQLPTPVSQTGSSGHLQQSRDQSVPETSRESDLQADTISPWTDFLDDELYPLSPDSQ